MKTALLVIAGIIAIFAQGVLGGKLIRNTPRDAWILLSHNFLFLAACNWLYWPLFRLIEEALCR